VPEGAADPRADPPVVVALGRLGPDKGSYVVLDAFAAIAGRHPAATLVMAGDGETEGVLAAARAAGLADRVSVPGWVGTAEVARLLRTATVFALPSRIEGLPMSMLEAMAHGLPVVETPVGRIPDVVSDGVDGRLVRPDDPEGLAAAIDALLSDRETAARLGAAARGCAALGRILSLGRSLGRADRVAVGLVDQIGIDRDLILERAGQSRIGIVADQCIVERREIAFVAGPAARCERERDRKRGATKQDRSAIGHGNGLLQSALLPEACPKWVCRDG
jgi:hypothetical protein